MRNIKWVKNTLTSPLEGEIRFQSGKSKAHGLCYLHWLDGGRYHLDRQTGSYTYVPNPNPPHPQKAYQHTITNTYGMGDEDLIEMAEQMLDIKKVLIERVLGY